MKLLHKIYAALIRDGATVQMIKDLLLLIWWVCTACLIWSMVLAHVDEAAIFFCGSLLSGLLIYPFMRD